jgi:hypothetical protein
MLQSIKFMLPQHLNHPEYPKRQAIDHNNNQTIIYDGANVLTMVSMVRVVDH